MRERREEGGRVAGFIHRKTTDVCVAFGVGDGVGGEGRKKRVRFLVARVFLCFLTTHHARTFSTTLSPSAQHTAIYKCTQKKNKNK
jgi:hypothetical protein